MGFIGPKAMRWPSFSIIVPTFQRRSVVCDALRAISRISYIGRLEIIIVVDGSTDGSAEALSLIPCVFPVNIITQSNSGASKARNLGAAAASGEILLFLDDDMICEPDIAEQHARSYAEGADAILGDIPLDPDSAPGFLSAGVGEWAAERSTRLDGGGDMTLFDLLTGHLSIRRSVFEEIGGFDDKFTAGGTFGNEDLDLGTRLLEHFTLKFNPRAISRQKYVVTYSQNMTQWFQAGQADVAFSRKHPSRARELFDLHGASDAATFRFFIPIARLPLISATTSKLACFLAERLWGRAGPIDKSIKWFFLLARDIMYWSGVNSRGGIPANNPVLVLCYHSISDLSHDKILNEYGVPMRQFELHLDYLIKRGAQFITGSEFSAYMQGKAGVPRRAVLLTFDDCYADLIGVSKGVLYPRQIPAVAFAVSGIESNSNEWDQDIGSVKLQLLKDDELIELQRLGVEIGCHSRTHRLMTGLSRDEIVEETGGAAEQLESNGIIRPRLFAYPYGESNAESKRALLAAGFVAAFGLKEQLANRASDPMDIPRVEILARDKRWRFWFKTTVPYLSRHSNSMDRHRPDGSGLRAQDIEEIRVRFSDLPSHCKNFAAPGIDEVAEWRDWTHIDTTPDQSRIESYLSRADLSRRAVLHIGVGNSSLALCLAAGAQKIIGTTISPSEMKHATTLNIPNYRCYLHNKYSGIDLPEGMQFDFIADNNPSTFCCCLHHFNTMMSFYNKVLAPNGQIITDREGLGWVVSTPDANPRWKFSFDDLAYIGAKFGLSAFEDGPHTIILSRRQPPPTGVERIFGLARSVARRAKKAITPRVATWAEMRMESPTMRF